MNVVTARHAGDSIQMQAGVVRLAGLLLLAAIGFGILVRAVPVLSADFPLNDGGLFAVMSRDLRDNGFLLPATTSYNGGEIPFGYPPLGLYLNALIGPLFGTDGASLRVLPLLITCLTIPAFWFMVRGWFSPATAAVATLAWAVIPRSWMWQVGGGGLTRSLGMLFAFLAVGATIRLLETPQRRWWILAPLCAGLTALSHLESAAFVGATLGVAWLVHHRSLASLRTLAVVALLAAVVASPWIVAIVAQHGLTPLTAAGGSRAAFMNIALAILVSLRWTAEPFVEVGAILGIIGLGIAVATGRWWLPLWIVAIFFALPGGAATYAMVPWALLIALAVSKLVELATPRRALTIGAVLLVVALASSLWARYEYLNPLSTVSPAQRAAMTWAGDNTPTDATFLVVTGSYWPIDATAEWFPTLSNRRSANTVQGKEFTSSQAWEHAVFASGSLDECVTGTAQCLVDWGTQWNIGYDYVFIPRGRTAGVEGDACCDSLALALSTDDRFHRVAELEGAWVFEPLSKNTSPR